MADDSGRAGCPEHAAYTAHAARGAARRPPPDPVIDSPDGTDPAHEALLADSVGLALLVVLETPTPPERLAFVLHDMFGVPFEELGEILERSPGAARQLASRARRRVRGADTVPEAPLPAQWEAVEAFLAAAREGDFDALLAVLDPEVVLRADGGPGGHSREVRAAQTVASQALTFRHDGLSVRRALINGAAGLLAMRDGRPFSLGAFTVRKGRIVEIDFLTDPQRLARLDLSALRD